MVWVFCSFLTLLEYFVIFIFGSFIQMLWFFLDLTIVLSSERVYKAQEDFGVNKLELFASESFFFFFFLSTNANQLLSWKAVANSPHTLVLIPCSSPNTNNGKLNHVT